MVPGEARVFEIWAAVCVLTIAVTFGVQKLILWHEDNSAMYRAQKIIKDTMYAQNLAIEEQVPVQWMSSGGCRWTVRLEQFKSYRHSTQRGSGGASCEANTDRLVFDKSGQLDRPFTFRVSGGDLMFVIHITRWGYLSDHIYPLPT